MYKIVVFTSLIGLILIGSVYLQKDPSVYLKKESIAANTEKGLIAYVSPTTGELTTQPATVRQPTAGDITQSSALNQSANTPTNKELPPIKYTTYANGMIRAELNGHFMVPQMATVDCQGKLHTKHTEQLEVTESCVTKN